ncbi:MAG: monovalent cation/H+ antiporter subunit D family protein [Pseudomonadota bacterium]
MTGGEAIQIAQATGIGTQTGTALALSDQYAMLTIVVPLFGAGIAALMPRAGLAWAVATIATIVSAICAALLLVDVTATGAVQSYAVGGWLPPYGIEYRIDLLNAYVLAIVAGVAAFMMPFALRTVPLDVPTQLQPWYYAAYLLCLCGLLGMAASGDAFNIFVFMEISSLATYVLIAMGRDKRALIAAYQYLIVGTIGATFYVIGIGLLYIVTGTLNLADLATRLGDVYAVSPRAIEAALAFIVVGIGLKLALFPLHVWLPNAYTFAPPFATVFLAATATKVAIYVLVRLYFSTFGGAIEVSNLPITEAILVLAITAMFAASFLAFYENRIERMLAYSSVAQVGYIMLGVSLANESGLTGGLVHIQNHAVSKALLFIAVGAIVARMGHVYLDKLAGVGRQMPITMGAFVVGGLSIIGVPGTAGFISKWHLGTGAMEADAPLLVFMIVASSIIAVLYIGRFIEIAYFRPVSEECQNARDPGPMIMLPIVAFAAAVIYFGLDTTWSADVARSAAAYLLAGLQQ